MPDQIKNLSHQMRLFGIHSACDRRAREAVSRQLHPLEFLRLILEDELLSRKDRVSRTLTTRARFRFSADLEDWDLDVDRGITRQKIRELSSPGFLHNKENLLIPGKTGEGKTHLAIAIGKRVCQEGMIYCRPRRGWPQKAWRGGPRRAGVCIAGGSAGEVC